MPNYRNVASALSPQAPALRVRFGVVQSVESDRTITLTVGGSTETIAGVRYASSMTPCPGKAVFCLTDGVDLFAVDHMAADDLTLAPRAYRTSDTALTTATDELVSFQAVASDAWGTWSSGAASRLTAQVTGRYTATAVVRFASNSTGFRAAWILKNGTDTIARVNAAAVTGSPTMLTVSSTPTDLAKGDYLQLYVRQNSGGNLDLVHDGTYFPSLGFTYLGP